MIAAIIGLWAGAALAVSSSAPSPSPDCSTSAKEFGGAPAAGCSIPQAQAGEDPTAVQPMKGWELYSWQEGRGFKYALVPGTNRPKNAAELKKVGTTDPRELRDALSRIAPGTELSWNRMPIDGLQLRIPRGKAADDLKAQLRAAKLKVTQ